MAKETLSLKNNVLDILEDYLKFAVRFNNGEKLYAKRGSFNKEIKITRDAIHRLREATIVEDK